MQRISCLAIATAAMLAAVSGHALAQETTIVSVEDLANPAEELSGTRVKVDGGRVFAASPRAAVLKVDDLYVSLAYEDSVENGFPWQDCRGLEPIDECRMSVTGTLVVRPDRDRPELHDVAAAH